MWPEILTRLQDFSSAVLTGLDADGYPTSVRCHPQPDHDAKVLQVEVPGDLEILPGPAGLLCHQHDEQLWRLKSFLVRGTLEHDHQGWVFRPGRLVRGMDRTLVSNLQLMRSGRRTTKRYLAARGLSRPAVPWSQLAALKEEARLGAR